MMTHSPALKTLPRSDLFEDGVDAYVVSSSATTNVITLRGPGGEPIYVTGPDPRAGLITMSVDVGGSRSLRVEGYSIEGCAALCRRHMNLP